VRNLDKAQRGAKRPASSEADQREASKLTNGERSDPWSSSETPNGVSRRAVARGARRAALEAERGAKRPVEWRTTEQ